MPVMKDGKWISGTSYGVGDVVATLMKQAGIEPCEDCERRRKFLNEMPKTLRDKIMSILPRMIHNVLFEQATPELIAARKAVCENCPAYGVVRGVSKCAECAKCSTIDHKIGNAKSSCPKAKW